MENKAKNLLKISFTIEDSNKFFAYSAVFEI